MVAIDFPSAPTVGQEVTLAGGTYIWNGQIWTVKGSSGGGSLTVSDTAPAAPAAGDAWWESDTGILWLWYTDATGSQWVQINSGGTGGSSLNEAPLDGEMYGRQSGNWAQIMSEVPPTPAPNNWQNLQAQPGNYLVLPPGGTWAWWAFSVSPASYGISNLVFANVDAGGTTISTMGNATTHTGCAWRLA